MLTRTAADWERVLSDLLNVPVEVVYGKSRSTPVQVRWDGGSPRVRFHEMFADAPPEVAEAIAAWLRSGKRARRACRELDEWIHERLQALPPAPKRATKHVRAGEAHDLGELVTELCGTTLAGEFGTGDDATALPDLTWGRRAKSRSRHTLQLGSYSPELHLVRIHPVLDQERVPAWFVRYVLFHELLHALIPARREDSARVQHHCPEFRKRESEYCDYSRALLWERRNLPALIRSARNGKPLPKLKSPASARVLQKLQGLLFPN